MKKFVLNHLVYVKNEFNNYDIKLTDQDLMPCHSFSQSRLYTIISTITTTTTIPAQLLLTLPLLLAPLPAEPLTTRSRTKSSSIVIMMPIKIISMMMSPHRPRPTCVISPTTSPVFLPFLPDPQPDEAPWLRAGHHHLLFPAQ